eukprot:4332589-Karenia_brevis.AAC.1
MIESSKIICACVKHGQWQNVAPLHDEMCVEGLSLGEISFNAAISACQNGGQWQRVAPLFSEMRRE